MNAREFSRRRRALMRMMGKGGIAILPAAPVRLRNRDVDYAYRQDSDFFYLSGLAEPEAPARRRHRSMRMAWRRFMCKSRLSGC